MVKNKTISVLFVKKIIIYRPPITIDLHKGKINHNIDKL